MHVLILVTVLYVLYLIVEYVRHSKNVDLIPERIHVNGTRGKSSVARLIAQGLNAGGVKTITKTTGTTPRIIFDDQKEANIERLFGANIIEQKYVFRFIKSLKPKAAVIECMAVNPAYQWVTERRFVKSTVSVITNSRPDHLDLMGNTIDSVTKSLANTIPESGICFTSEKDQFHTLKEVADKRSTKIMSVESDKITDEIMKHFSYIEHKDNVALALAVCTHLGVDKKKALEGMYHTIPDPGALRRYFFVEEKKNFYFYNVFAANDPESTVFIWNEQLAKVQKQVDKIIILNSRSDRFYRSLQLLEAVKDLNFNYLVLTGDKTDSVYKHAKHEGIDENKLISLGESDPEKVHSEIAKRTMNEAHIFGIGNIAGKHNYGYKIVGFYNKKSKEYKSNRNGRKID